MYSKYAARCQCLTRGSYAPKYGGEGTKKTNTKEVMYQKASARVRVRAHYPSFLALYVFSHSHIQSIAIDPIHALYAFR